MAMAGRSIAAARCSMPIRSASGTSPTVVVLCQGDQRSSLEPAPLLKRLADEGSSFASLAQTAKRRDGISAATIRAKHSIRKACIGTTRSHAARCPSCCRRRRRAMAPAGDRIPRPADQLRRAASHGRCRRRGPAARRLWQGTSWRCFSATARIIRSLLRRAESRRPRRASQPARWRARAVA